MKKNTDTGFRPLEKSMLARIPHPVLKVIGTEHVHQILGASLSVEKYLHGFL